MIFFFLSLLKIRYCKIRLNFNLYFCEMKNLISSLLFFFICLSQINAQLVINEYTAANYDTYTDNYGEYEDWIEIYNPTASAIDINGWFLTDKTNNPTKWMVPSSFIVPSMGTAIIYCS